MPENLYGRGGNNELPKYISINPINNLPPKDYIPDILKDKMKQGGQGINSIKHPNSLPTVYDNALANNNNYNNFGNSFNNLGNGNNIMGNVPKFGGNFNSTI